MTKPLLATCAILVLTVVSWASCPTLSRIALRDFPPLTIAVLRCGITSALPLGILLDARGVGPGIARGEIPALAGLT